MSVCHDIYALTMLSNFTRDHDAQDQFFDEARRDDADCEDQISGQGSYSPIVGVLP